MRPYFLLLFDRTEDPLGKTRSLLSHSYTFHVFVVVSVEFEIQGVDDTLYLIDSCL